jgi:hypothetical protein
MGKRCEVKTVRQLCGIHRHTLVYSLISRGVLANKLKAAQITQTMEAMLSPFAALTVFAQIVVTA